MPIVFSEGRRLALLAILLFIVISLSAQDYRPGYILTNSGDSVAGFVRYTTAKRSERGCTFKPAKRAARQRYSPDILRGYGVYGDRALTSIILDQKHLYARVLAVGSLDLLRANKRYIIRKDSIQVLPPEKKVKVAASQGEVYHIQKPYAGVLNIAMVDCGTKADHTAYNESDLTRVVDTYNKCKDSEYKSIERRPIASASFNAFASYIHSDLLFRYESTRMNPSRFIGYGIGTDFFSPRIYDKIFLSAEATYVEAFYQGQFETQIYGYYERKIVAMDFTYIRLAGALRFNFVEAKRTPYFKIGFTRFRTINEDIHSIVERKGFTGETLTETYTGGYRVKDPQGVWAAIGYQRALAGNLTIFGEMRVEAMEGFVGTLTHSYSQLRNFSFSLGLKIN